MPVTPAQALKLAVKLRPDIGPEQGVLLLWIEEHREGWADLEEEDIKSRMLAKLAGLGELLLKLRLGVALQRTGQICTRRTALPQPLREAAQRLPCHKGSCIGCFSVACKLRGRLAGAACTSEAA